MVTSSEQRTQTCVCVYGLRTTLHENIRTYYRGPPGEISHHKSSCVCGFIRNDSCGLYGTIQKQERRVFENLGLSNGTENGTLGNRPIDVKSTRERFVSISTRVQCDPIETLERRQSDTRNSPWRLGRARR